MSTQPYDTDRKRIERILHAHGVDSTVRTAAERGPRPSHQIRAIIISLRARHEIPKERTIH